MQHLTRKMKSCLLLLAASLLAGACAGPTAEGMYSNMSSADFALAGAEGRSIFSSHNF